MKIYFDKRILTVFFITLIVLVVLGVFSVTSMQRLIQTARLLSHSSRVINTAELVTKSIVDVETGQRGYVITANEQYLEPFYASSGRIERYLNTLDSLTAGNPLQRRKVDTLRTLVQAQLRWTKNVIDSRRESFEKARVLVSEGIGKATTDSIRACIGLLQQAERDSFAHSNTISQNSLQQFQYSFIGLAFFIIGIILYLFYRINRSLRARIRAEAALKSVAEETRDLYDTAPCGYLSVNAELVLSNINKTLLNWLGYTEQQVIGKLKFEDLLTSESKKNFINSFEQDFEVYKNVGYVSDLEFEFQRNDGTSFPVVVNSAAVFNSAGEFVKSRSTVMDNTERKKAKDKILDLNKELEGFTYSVSHDLRAPLRSIIGYTTILKEEYHHTMDDEA
ncbi:MAG TPA: CHASE3 domain-containing protein, partial [Cyclobacteriaceae bacterium]|nr:CHASE3 domain-containing protein [Cyclobacteriaceae bacterium]